MPRKRPKEQTSNAQAKPRRRVVDAYPYQNECGQVVYEKLRYEPKSFGFRRRDEWGNEYHDLDGVELVLYRLPELIDADLDWPVFIVEGEKDVDQLRSLESVVATCNADGACKWRDDYSEYLALRDVVIIPDNDDPGRRHAQLVARSLFGVAASIRVLELDGLPAKGDVAYWLDAGHTVDELRELAAQVAEWEFPEGDDVAADGEDDDSADRTRSGQIIELIIITAAAQFFRSEDDDQGYVRLRVGDHWEAWRIPSGGFRSLVRKLFYEEAGFALTKEPLKDAIETLNAMALYNGQSAQIAMRTAGDREATYIDLCNADWTLVKVTADGWSIVTESPYLFIRDQNVRALPAPEPGGDWNRLRQLLNLAADGDWRLLQSWLVGAFNPFGPTPILCINGEQGSAKSTTCRLLRLLVDPHRSGLRAPPRSEQDLVLAANRSWLVAFDNVSDVRPWLSDALCRLCTGATFGTRTLYSNDEETLIHVRRPVLVNGIGDLFSQPDLVDRTISLQLPRLLETSRRLEEEVNQEFEEQYARFFGLICNAISHALRNYGQVRLERPPRMADFTKWAMAAAPACGTTADKFLAAYTTNRQDLQHDALEADCLIDLLQQFLSKRETWEGTPTKLRTELSRLTEDDRFDHSFPKSPAALSTRLNRLQPPLRSIGIEIETRREGHDRKRLIRLTQKDLKTVDLTDRVDRRRPFRLRKHRPKE